MKSVKLCLFLLARGSSVLPSYCLTGLQPCSWDKGATAFQGTDHHHQHHQPALVMKAVCFLPLSESLWLWLGKTHTSSHGDEPNSAFSQEQRLQQGLCASSWVSNCLSHCTSHHLRSAFSSAERATLDGRSLKRGKCFRDVGHHAGPGLPKTHLESEVTFLSGA